MCFYRSGQGRLYSNEELNRDFLTAKRKDPNLEAKQYRERHTQKLGGLVKLPYSTVSDLCANGMYADAAALYAKNNGVAMEHARLAISLLYADGRC